MKDCYFVFFKTYSYNLTMRKNNFICVSSFKLVQANRTKQVSDQLNTLNSLCSVLGLDVKDKICDICPTMVNSSLTKDVSDNTIKNLTSEIQSLREIKIHRMQKVIILVIVLHPSNTDLF